MNIPLIKLYCSDDTNRKTLLANGIGSGICCQKWYIRWLQRPARLVQFVWSTVTKYSNRSVSKQESSPINIYFKNSSNVACMDKNIISGDTSPLSGIKTYTDTSIKFNSSTPCSMNFNYNRIEYGDVIELISETSNLTGGDNPFIQLVFVFEK